ncbi:MAG TPA: hypothetical protein PLL71_04255 [Agriterribacter sp.]|nr:hypothetical protein [Agriterribacter sp.]HRQ49922.1 hypothetical protein [Agriterribacter sp.]
MKISPDDFDDILRCLIQERNNGNEYVAFWGDGRITRDELACFSTQYDAAEFCYENSTDLDSYYYMSVRSAYRTMSEAQRDKSLMVESNGLIDIAAMVIARYERLSPEPPAQENNYHHLKSTIMNEKNFDYLSKQIQFTGFGEGHKDELMQKMKENKQEFTIFHQQDFGKDNTVATLQFRRPEDGDMYFFNRYSLLLKSARHEDPIKQTFYINNDPKKKEQDDITLKEGYNLLSGRAVQKDLVNKDGEKYTAWMQLDFKATDKHGNYETKKFHQNYGYDLEQLLSKHPIKELNTADEKKMLLESLQRGNRQSVTLQLEGKEQRVFIEAAPQFKSINIYDSSMKRVNAQTLREGNSDEQSQKQDKKESFKVNNTAAGDDEGSPAQSEKKGRKKGQKIS